MARKKLYEIVNWGNKQQNESNKKMLLEADNYDFMLKFMQTENANDFTFKDICEVKLNYNLLKSLGKGLIECFLTKLRGSYRTQKDELKPEVFADVRMNIVENKGTKITLIRIVGGYRIDNNMRFRQTAIKIYELSSWEEVAEIKNTKKYDENKCIFTMPLPTSSLVVDGYAPTDRVELETLRDLIVSILIRTNAVYEQYLKDVASESSTREESIANKNKTSDLAGGTVVESDVEEEFPF